MKFLFAALLLSISAHAFSQSRHQQQQRDRLAISALIKSIQVLAEADLTCTSNFDCLMVNVGSRSCGGPSGYILTSARNDNLGEIEFLSRSSEFKERVFNQKYEIMSTCEVRFPPVPSCQNFVCSTSDAI
jgi:hypothetical protein